MHKEILLDFDDAEANAFINTFGMEILNLLCGCEVHFLSSTMQMARKVNTNSESVGYTVFMFAKRISTETSRENVEKYFDVLCSQKPLDVLCQEILADSCFLTSCSQIDTSHWTEIISFAEWWRNPWVLKELSIRSLQFLKFK